MQWLSTGEYGQTFTTHHRYYGSNKSLLVFLILIYHIYFIDLSL